MLTPPHAGLRAYPHCVNQFTRAQPITQGRFITVTGINEHRAARDARSQRGFDLRLRYRALGRKGDFPGYARALAARFVLRPFLGQILGRYNW